MDKATCPECRKAGLQEVAKLRGLCMKHYHRARYTGTLDKTPPPDACPTCVAEDRTRPRKARFAGLCEPHYKQGVKAGTVTPVYTPRRAFTLCIVVACEQKPRCKGMCTRHYAAARRGVQLEIREVEIAETFAPLCSFDGCGTHVSGHGLCAAHLSQKRRGIELRPVRHQNRIGGTCQVLRCTREAMHLGLCDPHYNRKRRGEPDWDREITLRASNGSGSISHGYRIVQQNGRSRGEHRIIAEQLLGRPLFPNENVHHVNGQRADNRVDGPFVMDDRGRIGSGNLEIWETSQPSGQQVGAKLTYYAEFFGKYGGFDMEITRRVAATAIAVLGQLGTPQEQKAAAAFARALASGSVPEQAVELDSALF